MALPVQRAHEDLRQFCGSEAGIGLSKDLIQSILQEHIRRSRVLLGGLPSNQRFDLGDEREGLSVSFDVSLDSSQTKFFLTHHSPISPQVCLKDITAKLTAHIDGRKICEIDITFHEIQSKLSIAEHRIQLIVLYQRSNETGFVGIWENDQKTKSHFEKEYNFIDNTWRSLKLHFKAISIIATHDIASAFLEAVEFPDLFSIFKGIVFGEGGRFAINDSGNLLMFTASSSLAFQECPIAPVTGTVRLDSSVSNASTSSIDIQVQQSSPALQYPSKNTYEDRSKEMKSQVGHVFLHTPTHLLNVNLSDMIRPAIKIANRGRWGPFYYRWEVTPSLMREVSVSLVDEWPVTFNVDAPLDVSGQAGAGMKIGSVRYEALGAVFTGIVEPFTIQFRIMLDWSRREIVFESKIEEIKGEGFRFTTSPLDFPLGKIVDVILGEAAKRVVNAQAEKTLSVTRVSVANLNLLESVADLQEGLAGHADSDGNVTMGVTYANLP